MQFSEMFLTVLVYAALVLSGVGAAALLVMLVLDLRGKRMW